MDAENSTRRPVLYWDADCNFCRGWVERWRQTTGSLVDYQPLQNAPASVVAAAGGARLDRIVLARPDGSLVTGAEAALTSLATGSRLAGLLLGLYRRSCWFRALSEGGYHHVARQRETYSRLTRLAWGRETLAPTYDTSGWLFPRLIGLVFLCAFGSLWVQIDGLSGSRGLWPVAAHLENIHAHFDAEGRPWEAFRQAPSLLWLGANDTMLHLWLGVGVIASVSLLVGWYPAWSALVAWATYLSFVAAVPVFLNFQWDALLLEAGLLTALYVPWQRWLRRGSAAPSRLGRWLVWWLLFRLMFESGVVKLYGYDAMGYNAWLAGTALNFHYFTQPIPVWTSWWWAQLPEWWHRFSVVTVLAIELVVPFFILGPRRIRLVAFWAFSGLMLLIMASGHYGFFNLLTLVLCLALVDDASWPARWRSLPTNRVKAGRVQRLVLPLAAVVLVFLTTVQLLVVLRIFPVAWIEPVLGPTAPWRSANSYGLFSAMTTERPEITIEASADGVTWETCRFRWKMDPARDALPFALLHMPRLDWQMWFAALEMRSRGQPPPWLPMLLERLSEQSPPVMGLLAPGQERPTPPRYFRVRLDLLEFTTPEERRSSGRIWRATPLPPYTLEAHIPR